MPIQSEPGKGTTIDIVLPRVTAATLRELGYTGLEAGSRGAAPELLERQRQHRLAAESISPCPA